MLVILDRDGVINEDIHPHGVTSLDMLRIYPFAATAIRHFNDAGYHIIIATNQSAIGKGLLSEEDLLNIHTHLTAEIHAQSGATINHILYCPDHPDRPTRRRKPAPGMVEEALHIYNADPVHTHMIGDALRDLQAAHAAGCQPVLVRTGKGSATEATLPHHPSLTNIACYANVLDAALAITATHRR